MSAVIPQLHPLSQFQAKILKAPQNSSFTFPACTEHFCWLCLILGALFEARQPLGTWRSPWLLGCGVLALGAEHTASNKLNKSMGFL